MLNRVPQPFAVSAGASSASSGTVVFSNSNNVSFGQNGSTLTATATFAQSVQTQSLLQAIYDGTNSITTGTIRFTNANGVSFSVNGQTLSASVLAQSAESQSAGISNLGNTAGTSGIASGAQVRLLLAGGNNITLSQSVNGASATVTVVAFNQTNQSAIKGLGVSNTGNTLGNTGISSGIDFVIAASGAVTASQSTGATNTVWLSVAAQTNQSAIKGFGVSNTGNTLGNTGISSGIDWVVAASGAVTASQSTGATNTVWLSVAAQTNQSAIKGLGVSNTGNTLGNTGISSGIDWVVAASGAVTASQSTGVTNTIWLSVAAQTAESQSLGMATSTAGGGTGGTSGSASGNQVNYGFYAGSNITLSQSLNGALGSMSIYGPAAGAANINFSAGTTSSAIGSVVFSDSNRVSFGLNGSTITAKHALNFSASTTSNNISDQIVFSNANGITFGLNGSTITASFFDPTPASYWRNAAAELINQTQTISFNQSTSYVQPMVLANDVSIGYVRLLMSLGATRTTSVLTSANATGNYSALSTIWFMLYTNGTGASSLSLQSVASASAGITQVWSLSANTTGSQYTLSQSITHPITGGTSQFTTGVTTSLTNYSLGSLSLTRFTGLQHLDLPFSTVLAQGNYWAMFGISSTQSTAGFQSLSGLQISQSFVAISQVNSAVPLMGQTTVNSVMLQPGIGSFSTNAIGTTGSLDMSNVTSSASHPLLPIQFLRTA